MGDCSRPRHALSLVRGAVRNILAPHRKACQCLFPILPQCDSFLIIVFPVSLAGIFRHMSIEWRIAKKRCIAALNSHLLLGVNAGINGRNDSVRRFRQRSKMRVALASVAECLSFVVEPDQCGHGLVTSAFVKPGRDYITGAKPGYSKYAYPHPLRPSN